MKIDWRATQGNITAAVDGSPGRETWGKLFACGVARPFDDTFRRLGESAAKNFEAYGVAAAPLRIIGIIAETGNETGGFRKWEENLNYSAQGLANTWPTRFAVSSKAKVKVPNARAMALARRPQDIAIATYGERMGNLDAAHDTDEHPDGWQYRGRGAAQITGRAMYEAMGKAIGLDLVAFPELAADPAVSLLIALEFCKQNRVFAFMDSGDALAERRAWNGGLIGFDEVQVIRMRLSKIIVTK